MDSTDVVLAARTTEESGGGGGGKQTAHVQSGPTGGQFTSSPGSKTTPTKPPANRSAPKRSLPAKGGGVKPLAKKRQTLSRKGPNDPAEVKQLQALLKALKISGLAVDGNFGADTEAAVKAVQEKLGLKPTGRCSASLLGTLEKVHALSPCVVRASSQVLAADGPVGYDDDEVLDKTEIAPGMWVCAHADGTVSMRMPADAMAKWAGGVLEMAAAADEDEADDPPGEESGEYVEARRSYPGQRWRHGWIPFGGAGVPEPKQTPDMPASLSDLDAELRGLDPAQKRQHLLGQGFSPSQIDQLLPPSADMRPSSMSDLAHELEGLTEDEQRAKLEAWGYSPMTITELLGPIKVDAAAGHDTTMGHDELHHYWVAGKGLARWRGSPTPWTTLVALLSEHVPAEKAKVFASKWFHEVFGIWSGARKGANPLGNEPGTRSRVKAGAPHPGQRYRHGWIPVADVDLPDAGAGEAGSRTSARDLIEMWAEPGFHDRVREVFNGSFAGFTTSVTGARKISDGIEVSVLVADSSGDKVGEATRRLHLDSAGRVWAEHARLELDPHVQGQGFASQYNAHLETWYRASGVDRIQLHANIDVGGYAWARAGYDWADGRVPDDIRQRIARGGGPNPWRELRVVSGFGSDSEDVFYVVDEHGEAVSEPYDNRGDAADEMDHLLQHRGPAGADGPDLESADLLARIDSGDKVLPIEVAMLPRGREILLGSAWDGVKWL